MASDDAIAALYRACDPVEPLQVQDPRNVDLDSVSKGAPRGGRWAHRMAREIRLSSEPLLKLFSGLPGSGKSTELRRLLTSLDDHYLTVLIDAEKELDLASPIDVPEVVAVIVQEVERSLLIAEGADPNKALTEGYGRRLWTFLKHTDITPESLGGSEGPVKLTAALRTNPSLRQRFRNILKPRLTSFLEESKEYVQELQDRVAAIGKKRIVVALDSLEKLQGPNDSWDDVIDSAAALFSQDAAYLRRLPLHAVYTVPTALLSRRLDIEFMPAVKISERTGAEYPEGVNALLEVIRRRLSEDDLILLFGEGRTQIQLLERVIRDSGGYLRNLVKTLREVVLADEHPVDADFLERVFQGRVDEYKRLITKADYEMLASIARDKELILPDASEVTRRQAEHLLINNVVLRYQNSNDWFDLHPAVKCIPGLREHLEEGKARR